MNKLSGSHTPDRGASLPHRIPSLDLGSPLRFTEVSLGDTTAPHYTDALVQSPTVMSPRQGAPRTFSWMPGPDNLGVTRPERKSATSRLQSVRRAAQAQPFLVAGTAIGLAVFAAGVGIGLGSHLIEQDREIAIFVGLAVAVLLMCGGNFLDNARKKRPSGPEDIELGEPRSEAPRISL
jgi:hypothetical protein